MPVISATTHRMECDRPCRACGLMIQRDTVGVECVHGNGGSVSAPVWWSVAHRECHAELANHPKTDDFGTLRALPTSAKWRAFYERERAR